MKTEEIAQVVEALEGESTEFGKFQCFFAEIGGKGVLLHEYDEKTALEFEEETEPKKRSATPVKAGNISPFVWGIAAISLAIVAGLFIGSK